MCCVFRKLETWTIPLAWVKHTPSRGGQRRKFARPSPGWHFYTGLDINAVCPTLPPKSVSFQGGALILRHFEWVCSTDGVGVGYLMVNGAAGHAHAEWACCVDVTCLFNSPRHFWFNIFIGCASLYSDNGRPWWCGHHLWNVNSVGRRL